MLDDNNSSPDLNIYVESETIEDGPLYEAVSKPFKLDKLQSAEMAVIDKESGLPRVGVSKIAVSPDSSYIATVCESLPSYVWIWDVAKMQLNSLIC